KISPKLISKIPCQTAFTAVPLTIHILDPTGGFLRRAGSEIQRDLRSSANEAAEFEVLVGSELIVFGDAPGDIHHRDPSIKRTDAIFPMIRGSVVAAKAQDGSAERFRHLDHFRVHSMHRV